LIDFFRIKDRFLTDYTRVEHMRSLTEISMGLLNTLQSIPYPRRTIVDVGITVFSDNKCERPRDDVTIVMLETTTPGNEKGKRHVYPTTKKDYIVGKEVAWEWGDKSWNESWYMDPNTGENKEAWKGAVEFTGRYVDEL
jgi:hypothetical protein